MLLSAVYENDEVVLIGELLEKIASDIHSSREISPRNLYVPDEAGTLFPIDGLVYDDAKWLSMS